MCSPLPTRFRPLFAALVVAATGLSLARAEEPKKPESAPAKAKPAAGVEKSEKPEPKPGPSAKPAAKPAAKAEEGFARYVTRAEPLVVKVKVSGTVESTRETPVEMNLKRWSDLTVVKAAAHGTAVRAGDLILELETRDLARKIDDLKRDLPARELELAAVELDLDKAEKTTPLSLERALREKTQAEQDLAHFEDQARPMQERAAKEDVKEVAQALAYAQEELGQLKKMYEKDDLTEETEEIILKRAENSVSRYQWMLEQAQARSERALHTQLPREHENLKRSLELRQIEWRAGEKAMRDGLEKQRLAAAAKRREIEELRRALAEHEADLSAMRVVAPHDGIVYYGMSQRGKWTTASLVDRKLIPGGKLTMREIVMTVVDPSRLRVRLALTEEQLKDLAEGQAGSFAVKSQPDRRFEGRLDSILYVPFADKTFDAVFAARIPKDAAAILPGMSAEAEIVVHDNPAAILVPKAAVGKPGAKEQLTLSDGRVVAVKTGRSEGDRVEILEGLEAGATVRVPLPKTEAAQPAPSKEPAKEPAKQG